LIFGPLGSLNWGRAMAAKAGDSSRWRVREHG